MKTAEQFESATGWAPVDDDLERANCNEAGNPGHWACGWCNACNKPRHVCAHFIFQSFKRHERTTMKVSIVTVAVHSTSEHDGRRAAEAMYGGALSWVLTNSGTWEGSYDLDGVVATVRVDEHDVPSSQSSSEGRSND